MRSFVLILLVCPTLVWAQAPRQSPRPQEFFRPPVGVLHMPSRGEKLELSRVQWQERMRVTSFGALDEDIALLTGWRIKYHREFFNRKWGWSWGAGFGIGEAIGGGNNELLTAPIETRPWNSFEVSARAFRFLSPKITVGIEVPLIYRTLEWTAPEAASSLVSGQTYNFGMMADLTLQLSNRWSVTQGLGTLGSQNSTIWRTGAIYQF